MNTKQTSTITEDANSEEMETAVAANLKCTARLSQSILKKAFESKLEVVG